MYTFTEEQLREYTDKIFRSGKEAMLEQLKENSVISFEQFDESDRIAETFEPTPEDIEQGMKDSLPNEVENEQLTVKVMFETSACAHVVAVFDTEETYLKCLPILEKLAEENNFTSVTESIEG